MIRALSALVALSLFAIPWAIAPVKPIALAGGVGLGLAAFGIGGLWRWPALAAACAFLVEYAGALALARPPVAVGGALAFGLALTLLLASVELARGCRGARVDSRVPWSQVSGCLGFAAPTLGVSLLGLALSGGLAASIPSAAAPLLAGLGALGVVLALATLVKRPVR
jgi:hypothetical protein